MAAVARDLLPRASPRPTALVPMYPALVPTTSTRPRPTATGPRGSEEREICRGKKKKNAADSLILDERKYRRLIRRDLSETLRTVKPN